jgi:hypothetical protein
MGQISNQSDIALLDLFYFLTCEIVFHEYTSKPPLLKSPYHKQGIHGIIFSG